MNVIYPSSAESSSLQENNPQRQRKDGIKISWGYLSESKADQRFAACLSQSYILYGGGEWVQETGGETECSAREFVPPSAAMSSFRRASKMFKMG